MIWVLFGLSALAITALVWGGWKVAGIQTDEVSQCFDMRAMHDKILCGEMDVSTVSNEDLISLRGSFRTHVGMGGIGPAYFCSLEVFTMIGKELETRRSILT